jgi:hypothetical protein
MMTKHVTKTAPGLTKVLFENESHAVELRNTARALVVELKWEGENS